MAKTDEGQEGMDGGKEEESPNEIKRENKVIQIALGIIALCAIILALLLFQPQWNIFKGAGGDREGTATTTATTMEGTATTTPACPD